MKRRHFLPGMLAAEAAGFLSAALPDGPPAWAAPVGGPQELFPGAYQISSLFGGRNLFQYLLVGDSTVLFDTGIALTPHATIFPSLEKLGLQPERITLAINSHADGDHQGGNFALKQASPHTLLAGRYQLLLSIRGLGPTRALHVLAELMLLGPDVHVHQWVAYAGLDPRQHSSGSSVEKKPRISKAGNKHLRRALYMPALVATMRKLLHAIYGMFRDVLPFEGSKVYQLRPAALANTPLARTEAA